MSGTQPAQLWEHMGGHRWNHVSTFCVTAFGIPKVIYNMNPPRNKGWKIFLCNTKDWFMQK